MKVSLTPIDKIHPYQANARSHSDKQVELLANAIVEFGFDQPIVVDRWNVVIKGHGRLLAAKRLGLETVPVVIADQLSPLQVKAARLADNRISELSEWDTDLLIVELKDLFTDDFDLSSLGFDDISFDLSDEDIEYPVSPSVIEAIQEVSDRREEVETRIQEAPATPPREVVEVEEDDFEQPEEEAVKTNIVLGDLFEIGDHRLLCGSSTDAKDVKRLMNGKLADMVITDPPYNVAYVGKTKDALTIQNDEMSDSSFYSFLFDFYSAFGEVTKMGGAWYVWHADSEGANFRKAMVDGGLLFKQCLVWVENSLVMGRQDYHWKHEPCLYGWKPGAAHNWFADRKQTTVLNFDRPQRNAEHPTMKPIALFAYLIQNSSDVKQLVADGFLGSGSTMVAAHQLDRRCYGMELSPVYCQVIVERMIKLDPTLTIKKNGVDVTNSFK